MRSAPRRICAIVVMAVLAGLVLGGQPAVADQLAAALATAPAAPAAAPAESAVPTSVPAAVSPAAVSSAAGSWQAIPPHRLWSEVELSSDGPRELSVEVGGGGIPATGVAAVALTVTVLRADHPGSLTLWAYGGARPAVPSLSFGADMQVTAQVWVPVDSSGHVSIGSSGPGSVILTVTSVGFTTTGTAPGPGSWVPLNPVRVLDTQAGPLASAPIRPQRALTPRLAGSAGLPTTGVAAVSMVVTVRNPTRTGFLTVRPNGEIPPGATPGGSSLNFNSGQPAVSNLLVVPLGADGRLQLFNNSYGEFDLSIDVTGYLAAGQQVTGGLVVPKMTRLIDTRNATGPDPRRPAGPLPAQDRYPAMILGSATIPAGSVAAVLLSVTVNNPAAAGTVSVGQSGRHPSGPAWDPAPDRSPAVSFGAGRNATGLVLVPLGTDGRVDFTNNSAGPLNLIVDVVGYVKGASPSSQLRWSNPTATIATLADPVLLDCPTVSFCMAVNSTGRYGIFDGQKWRAAGDVALPVDPNNESAAVTELSCPTTTFCAAANGSWIAVFRNHTWEPAIRPAQLRGSIYGLSCVSPSFCFAFENHGFAWTWNGSTWSAPPTVMAWEAQESDWPVEDDVSCAAPTFCVSVGSYGEVLSSADPAAVFSQTLPAPWESTGIDVSCLSATFCATLHTPSATTTFDGETWTAWDQIWPTPMTSLSCGSPTLCVTVGSGNRISLYDGTAWTDPARPVTVNGNPILVSCPTGDFCMSLDQQGRQLVGRR